MDKDIDPVGNEAKSLAPSVRMNLREIDCSHKSQR